MVSFATELTQPGDSIRSPRRPGQPILGPVTGPTAGNGRSSRQDKDNFLYLDGHVESLQIEDIRTGVVSGHNDQHGIVFDQRGWYSGLGWTTHVDRRAVFAPRYIKPMYYPYD